MRASFTCGALLLNLSVSYKAKLCVVSYRIARGTAPAGVAQSLKDALKSGDDEASKVQANVMLGEYFVMKGEFAQTRRSLEAVAQSASEPKEEYDDLLNDEIDKADLFLDMIGRFGFLAKWGDKFAV